MKIKLNKTVLAMSTGLAIISLTACGRGSNTISSLTDSDTTTSVVVGTTLSQASAADSTVPAITPSVVSGTTSGAAAAPAAGTTSGTSSAAITPAASAASTSSTLAQTTPTPAPQVESEIEAAPEEESFEPAGEGNTGVTTTDVKFRTEPDADNGDDNVIDELDEGTEVIVLGKEGDFYKVQLDDIVGYIHSDYIE